MSTNYFSDKDNAVMNEVAFASKGLYDNPSIAKSLSFSR